MRTNNVPRLPTQQLEWKIDLHRGMKCDLQRSPRLQLRRGMHPPNLRIAMRTTQRRGQHPNRTPGQNINQSPDQRPNQRRDPNLNGKPTALRRDPKTAQRHGLNHEQRLIRRQSLRREPSLGLNHGNRPDQGTIPSPAPNRKRKRRSETSTILSLDFKCKSGERVCILRFAMSCPETSGATMSS